MDFTQFTVNLGPGKRGRKPGSKKAKAKEESLSDKGFNKAMDNPKLNYIGKRDTDAPAIKYRSKYAKGQEEIELKIETLGNKYKELEQVPGGYIYMGGILVSVTRTQVQYIIPKGLQGDTFKQWKLRYWKQIQRLTHELNN